MGPPQQIVGLAAAIDDPAELNQIGLPEHVVGIEAIGATGVGLTVSAVKALIEVD